MSARAERIHLVLDREEKERFRRVAAKAGMSLSEWLREAAAEKVAASEVGHTLETAADLKAFFAACDAREEGREPDWATHQRVIEQSRSSGTPAL